MDNVQATFIVGKLSNRIRRRITEMSSSVPYTGAQGKVLHYLVAGKDTDIYQKDVEQEFTLRPSSATELLKKMEDNGLLYRVADKSDARKKKIILTDKALEYAATVQVGLDELEKEAMKGLKPKEIETFKKVCLRMMQNLEY